MPIELKLWKISDGLKEILPTKLEKEGRIHSSLFEHPDLLGLSFLPLGKEVRTDSDKRIDILGLDQEGNLIIIELKKDKTPRDIVAQCLDYAAWVKDLDNDSIRDIFRESNRNVELEQAFGEYFGVSLPETLNSAHLIIIVATELDPQTERIVQYLSNDYGVPINAVFFRYFKNGSDEIIARAWLIDPKRNEPAAAKAGNRKSKSEPWNGTDYYVSLGESEERTWEDCRTLGYISAGGGLRYIQGLKRLIPGNRVFVNVPRVGYVGVGIVTAEVKPMKEARVLNNGQEVDLAKLSLKAKFHTHDIDNVELCEHVVQVNWLKTVSIEKAYWETGLFANQHIACRLTNQFTLQKLSEYFELGEL